MKKAVIYARYSDERQTEQSIEGQIRRCSEFAAQQNYEILETYIDRAMSGKIDNRPAFLKLMQDSNKKAFEAVIVYQLDRFARNRYDSTVYEYKLNKNGVTLLSANENISDDPTGNLLKSVLIGLNEYYSAELAIKVDRGMRLTAEKCKHNGSIVPFGYKLDSERHYIVDELNRKHVEYIFNEYLKGSMAKSIIKHLQLAGAKTAMGRAFNRGSLDWILRNEHYCGVYKWRDYRKEDAFEAIISRDLFNRVQNKLRSNRHAPARGYATDYMLSCKLTCAKCGSNMVGEKVANGSGTAYFYYVCSNAKRYGQCNKKRISKDYLENAVYDKIVQKISEPSFIKAASEELERVYKESMDNSHILVFKNEKKAVEVKIENIYKAIDSGIVSDGLKDRLNQYEKELEILKNRIAKEEIVLEKLDFDIELFAFLLEKLITEDVEKPIRMKKLFSGMLVSGTVDDFVAKINLSHNGENEKNTQESVFLECSNNFELVGPLGFEPRTTRL